MSIKNKINGKDPKGSFSFYAIKPFLVLLFVFSSFVANATHIVGGHIDWKWISGKTYEIKVVFYRDCNGVQFQNPLYIGIFDRGTNLNTGYNIQLSMTSRQVLTLGDACFTPGVCVEEAKYIGQFDFTALGNTPNGLYFAMDVCCRNAAVQNISNPLNTGMTFYTEVPNLDPASPNHDKSVPLFGAYPKAYMCVNQINTLNFGATDLDGDSLVYSLVTPYNSPTGYDFSSALGTYDPYFTYTYDGIPIAGPYPPITWQTGYSINNILGTGSTMTIDTQTGVVTAFPTQTGLYGFCVQVDEYRNGVRIGRNRFDVQYTVLTCNDAPIIANNVICLNNTATVYTNTAPSGATYTWDLDGGTVTSGNGNGPGSFQVTWGTPGVKTISLEVRDINNCKYGPSVKTVTVNPVPTSNAGSNVTICQGTSTMLNGTASTGGTTYTWAPAGSLSSSSNGTPIASPTSSQNYTLTVTDANNCSAASTVSVTVANPIAVPAAQQNVDCYGTSTGIAAANAQSNISGSTFSYSWSPSGGNGAIASNLAGNVTYTLVITDQFNCTHTSSVTITQPSSPISTNVSGTNLLCFNDNSGTVTASPSGGNGSPYTYAWQTNPVQNSAGITGLAQGTYSVIVYDSKGCSVSSSHSITQPNAALDASVSATDANCYGLLGTATASAIVGTGTPVYQYSWSNGSSSASINAVAGTYSVLVTDANGCTKAVQNILIDQPTLLTTDSVVSDAHCNQNDGSASVSANGGSPGYTYSWFNGSTATSVTDLAAGIYTVTVTDNHQCAQVATVIVGNLQAPVLSYSVTSNNNCFGTSLGSATASATGGTGNLTYTWAPSGGNGQTATGLIAGVYTVTVTDAGNCVDIEQVTITQNADLVVTPSGVADVLCKGQNNGVAAVSVSGGVQAYTYSWSHGATQSSVTGLSPQSYTVVVTDNLGCSKSQTIAISEPNAVLTSVITQQTNLNCNNISTGLAEVTATGGNAGAYTYSWSPSGGNNSVASNLAAGSYTVLITDSKNCTSTSTVSLTQPAALASSIAPPAEICEQFSATISVLPTNGTAPYTYSWSNGLGTSQSYSVSPATTTTYTAVVTDNCGATSVSTVVVDVNPKPVANFGVSPATAVLSEETVTFSDSSSSNVTSWYWNFGDGSTATTQNATHEYLASGSYVVTLIVTTADGCLDTMKYTAVEVKKEIKIPNVFTPWSKDGVNDVFVITLSGVTEAYITIYDRWGLKMFETTDPKTYWDGIAMQTGRQAPEGTYYYIVKATFGDGEVVEEKGYLMLLK